MGAQFGDLMKTVLKSGLAFRIITIASALLFFATCTHAQSSRFHPAPIAQPNTTNVPVVRPLQPFPPGAPSPAARPTAPQAGQLVGTSCVPPSSQPAPIVAIVAALKCDPDLI